MATKKPIKITKAAMPSTPTGKETVYVDVDDEITSIIDKVKASDKKIIALVLPKRAAVLQSVVNMKLLKKAGQNTKKNIVLITSEASLLPLAGAAGLHVAKSLQSKPEIPPVPHHPSDNDTEDMQVDDEPALDHSAPIGALAAAAALSNNDDTETVELDNMASDAPLPGAAAKKPKKLKHLKIPNFEKFRLGFFLAGLGVVLLILGWYLAFVVMPKATITVTTDTTSVVSSFDFTVNTAQAELDANDQNVPATIKELKKTDSEKAPATGEKNNGEKAQGTVIFKARACAPNLGTPSALPAGSTVTSGGKNFTLQSALPFSFVGFADGSCADYTTGNGTVVAGAQGATYNFAAGTAFTVSGRSGVNGTGSTSGGTDQIIKIVTQKDIDDAVAKIKERVDGQVKGELTSQLETEQLFPLPDTMKSTEPKVTPTPAVNTEAAEVTVAWEATYTMLGIKRDSLVELIKKDIESEVDLQKQSITDDGIDAAVIRINNQVSPTEAYLNFRTSVTAGPELDEDAIKEAVRGKKRGEAEDYIGALPGVKDVVVEYSPFWVYSTPKAAKKITIIVEKPDQQPAEQQSNESE